MKITSYSTIILASLVLISCSKKNEDDEIAVVLTGAEILLRDSIEKKSGAYDEVVFIDENTGFVKATNPAKILKTTDGGITWKTVFNADNEFIYGLKFQNENLGMFMSYEKSQAISFYLTSDGGENWKLVSQDPEGALVSDFDWIDDSTIMYVGETFRISKDLGKTWDWVFSPQGSGQKPDYRIQFHDNNNAVAISGFGRYESFDGGKTWKEEGMGMSLVQMEFINTDHGMAVDAIGIALTTRDAGKNWQIAQPKYEEEYAEKFYSIEAVNNELAFYSGTNGIYRTKNGGDTYRPINKMKNGNRFYTLSDIYMVDTDIGYAVGAEFFSDTLSSSAGHSVVLKTTTGWE